MLSFFEEDTEKSLDNLFNWLDFIIKLNYMNNNSKNYSVIFWGSGDFEV